MSPKIITDVIARYFAAIRALDAESWLATFAVDAVNYEPGGPPLEGHESMRMFFNGVAGGFESIDMTPDQIFIVGAEAAVKWSARGAGKNGRRVAFEGVDLFTINNAGKIQVLKAYWDPEAMMADLMGESTNEE
jgi:steroid delta-isomerase